MRFRWNEFYLKIRSRISPVRILVLGFFLVILLGSLLLMLPCATRDVGNADFLTALFTATSATCVTGLVVVETGAFWTGFGQAVILLLIQIGGLGFMTVISVFFLLSGKRIGLKGRMVIAQAYSANDLHGMVSLVRRAAAWTFSCEAVGAFLLTLRFCRDFAFPKALWYGIFHAVSAFCNAGFDVLAQVQKGGSLTGYVGDVTVNLTIMFLIVTGGLGFFVLGDLVKNKKISKCSLYTKLVLIVNGALILGGSLVFACLEWENPLTFGSLPTQQKLLAALFQSVTTRTAGFASVPQGNLTESSLLVSNVLMLIGGSSGSTAGGVKTVTFAIVVLSALSSLSGRKDLVVFRKTISRQQSRDAGSILFMMLSLQFIGTFLLSALNGLPVADTLFESVSAICTVGLSTGITAGLTVLSKVILIMFMFFGRVGIMTISLAFLMDDGTRDRYRYAEEKMMIG